MQQLERMDSAAQGKQWEWELLTSEYSGSRERGL